MTGPFVSFSWCYSKQDLIQLSVILTEVNNILGLLREEDFPLIEVFCCCQNPYFSELMHFVIMWA